MTEKETFQFAQWSVEVVRRGYRRSVSIYLYPHKPIKVVAAKNTPQKAILEFLLRKKDWIEKNLTKFSELAERYPEKKIQSRTGFPFLGQEYQLKVVITLNKKAFVSRTEENILLHIPRNEWSADSVVQEHPTALMHLREFYKREAINYLEQRLSYWAEVMSLRPHQVRFREQKTRWGSCSSKKIINLNWRLIVFSTEIIDYVLVHELAHLCHMNHSQKFWNVVELYIKDYSLRAKKLKESQSLVEFLSERS